MPIPFDPNLAAAALDMLLDGSDTHAAFTALCARHPTLDGMVLDEHVATARRVIDAARAAAHDAREGDGDLSRESLIARYAFMPPGVVGRAFDRLRARG